MSGFESWRPSASSKIVLSETLALLDELANYLPLTIRTLFYRLMGRGLYGKGGYKSFKDLMGRARRARFIPFDAIAEDRMLEARGDYETSAISYLAEMREQWRFLELDPQRHQRRRVALWLESRGLVPMFWQHTRRYGVPVSAVGGYDSLQAKHALGKRLANSDEAWLFLHCGDYDPDGIAIVESPDHGLRADVLAFAAAHAGCTVEEIADRIEIRRLALTAEQCIEHKLPTDVEKTPKALAAMRARWPRWPGLPGNRNATVQFEALSPETQVGLVIAELERELDLDAIETANAMQELEQDRARAALARLPKQERAGRPRRYDAWTEMRAGSLRDRGRSIRQIAAELEIAPSTVALMLRRS